MSVLRDEVKLTSTVEYVNTQIASISAMETAVKNAIAAEFWRWYDGHSSDKITTLNIWIIHKTIRVKDIRPIFEMLFGGHP